MPEIAVHKFNSHGVPEMMKKLVAKRNRKREKYAAQNHQLPIQSLSAFIHQVKTQSVAAVSKQNSQTEATSTAAKDENWRR